MIARHLYIALCGMLFAALSAIAAPADNSKIINGHKFVDLGLPSGLLWAETNIEAETPANNGYFFAWGETEMKTWFDQDSYKYKFESNEYGTWYNKYGLGDNIKTLEKEDDAAYVNWGSPCRMPTAADFEELCNEDNCKWEWSNMDTPAGYHANGWKVISKKNGNWIFLPASGYIFGDELMYENEEARYWSSNNDGIHGDEGEYVYGLHLSDSFYGRSETFQRYYGCTIRPVAEAKASGKVNAAATDNTQDYKIVDGHRFVDLALPSGLLWAETNIGAETAADDGNYFAWGETELDNRASRRWKTYKYGSSDDNMTKYNSTDQKVTLDKEDDAAYVNWGPSCRMPSKEDFGEILNPANCECTWTSMTSSKGSIVKGYKITSVRNGKSIFLPASGNLDDGSVYNRGTDGEYWSCTLSESSADAYSLTFFQHRDNLAGLYRFWGCTIRPVAEQ